jgi:hypothetical protein
MAPHDDNDFIDREFEKSQQMPLSPSPVTSTVQSPQSIGIKRVPAREQLEAKVGTTQQRLAALKEEQDRLEKERIALEDLRRRRSEFSMGREEMIQNLTKGITILEEKESSTQRQLEAMGRVLGEFKDHLEKVEVLSEDAWDEENLNRELTRALITIENARKEWISAVPKFPVLDPNFEEQKQSEKTESIDKTEAATGTATPNPLTGAIDFEEFSWKQWAQFGLALTWPIAAVLLVGILMLVSIWLQGGS